jgi:hypothetical protein
MIDEEFASKFWSMIDKSAGPDGHWFLGRQRSTYGMFKYKGRAYLAHRIACILIFGPMPDGYVAIHECSRG